jgi:uroporphyrinogen-III synthase
MTFLRRKLIWITRSAPYSHSSANLLQRVGFRALVAPVLQIRPIASASPSTVPDALIFTGAHAVLHHPHDSAWRHLPVFTVGNHASETAAAAGYSNVRSAEGDVRDLEGLAAFSLRRRAKLLLFGSLDVASDLDARLTARGFTVERFIVSETRSSTDHDLRNAINALPRIDGICVYSPRSAQRVAEVLRSRPWHGTIFCLSEPCAAYFPARDHILVQVAERPDERALCDLVRSRWSDAIRRAAHPPSLDLRDFRSLVRTRKRIANDNREAIQQGPSREPNGDGDDPPPTAA